MTSHGEATFIGGGSPPAAEGAPQFAPGSLLMSRYRLAGPVGRGGMGIVYGADDLKIGQRVALKFLSPQLEHDPDRIARLVAEVRLGRRVAHPNVCRLYDIAEVESRHFIVMELVEGEDLDSLLERIGRLTAHKALRVARDVCAGLAAVHDQGIVHRDLKPGNVMIDSRGRARITDFGLAATVDGQPERRAIMGTLGYMAPEQARGEQPTAATDVYALGALIYEIFTGQPAFHVTSIHDRFHNMPPVPPSTLIPDIDPRIERLIARCLANDPADRPATARAVLEALPQPDILDAVMEAGETPPPEVVAAAGAIGHVPRSVAWGLLLVTAVCTFLGVLLFRQSAPGRLLQELPAPEAMRSRVLVLADRLAPGRDRTLPEWFGYEPRPGSTASSPDTAMRFWYRSGAAPPYLQTVTFDDPPQTETGAVSVEIDGAGRLLRYRHAPSRLEPASVTTPDLFGEAGMDFSRASAIPVPAAILPPVAADDVRAWQMRDSKTVVIAGTLRGTPVLLEVRSDTLPLPRGSWNASNIVSGSVLVLIFAGSFVLARKNLHMGRGDLRGAWRVAVFVTATWVASWALIASIDKLFEGIAYGVLTGALVGFCYVGVEPYVRRSWPGMLVSWNRLLQGRLGDALVARDLLIALTAGAVLRLTMSVVERAAGGAGLANLPSFFGTLHMLGAILEAPPIAVMLTFGLLFLLYVLTLLVRNRVVALAIVVGVLLAIFATKEGGAAVIGIIGIALVLHRFGLLAGIGTAYAVFLQADIQRFDLGRWYATPPLVALLIAAALLLWSAVHAGARRRAEPFR